MVATGTMMKTAFPVEEASKRALSELYEQFRDLRRGGTPLCIFCGVASAQGRRRSAESVSRLGISAVSPDLKIRTAVFS